MGSLAMSLPDQLDDQLTSLAEATGTTKTFLAVCAIEAFIKQETWQMAEIKKALSEADAGDFSSDEEIQSLDARWCYRED